MPGRNRRLDRALDQLRRISHEVAADLRLARTSAGISQDDAGSAVGISGSQFGRIERGELHGVSVEQWCRATAAVGLRLHVRTYPDGDPVRDTAQLRLLGRLRACVPAVVSLKSEVPLYAQTDMRAWDAVIEIRGHRDAVEAETRIRDGQALLRRLNAKLRDDRTIQHVFLLVADTASNRRAMKELRETLRSDLPLDSRQVLKAFREGRCPGASGMVFL